MSTGPNAPGLYIAGKELEVYPNVFVEKGIKLYCKGTLG